MKKKFFTAISIFSVLICIQEVDAAPIINNTPMTINDGSPIAISGLGFGTKSTSTPIIWDNFDSGGNDVSVNGRVPIVGSAKWTYYFPAPVTSSSNQRDGSNNLKLVLSSAGQTGRNAQYSYPSLTYGSKVFFSFWYRHSWGTVEGGDSTNQRQIKTWRLLHYEGSTYDTYLDASNWTYNDNSPIRSWVHVLYTGAGDVDPGDKDITPPLTEGDWRRHDIQIQIGSAPTVADGNIKYWVSEANSSGPIVKHIDDSTVAYVGANEKMWDTLWLGQWIGNTTTGQPFYTTLYYDDVYFDTSWQRVEIGDKPDWNACTHREIQIPTQWLDNQITITPNTGTFTNGQTAYLFVVDANGTVSNSQQITIGGSVAPSSLPTSTITKGQTKPVQ